MKKLVVYSAVWCGPCATLKRNLEAISSDLEGLVDVERLDIDSMDRLELQNSGVKGVPTAVLFVDGVEFSRKTGAMSQSQLLQWLVDTD